jgi:N-hydroxyarylamine O-acetyltransferase
MDIESYLTRIGYRGPLRPSVDVLRRLHRQHLLQVPFENLDILLGRLIVLDQEAFYNKIVGDRRGGYCYELNGCFAWLLRKLGFKVSMISARVARKGGGFSPEFDHMTLLVRLRGHWLADVGFGDLFAQPLQLDKRGPQDDDVGRFLITRKKEMRLLSRWDEENNSWTPQYQFTLRPRKLGDFATRNHYQQISPNSHFTHGRLISQLTPTGRVTLTNEKLVLTTGRKRVERPVKSHEGFDALLAKHFHIRLS